jgi:hypothetical protein
MTGKAGTASAFVLAAMSALAPRSASAYVREVTSTGMPVVWKNPCITMHLFLGDPPPMLTADQFLQAGVLAASVWSQPYLACSDIRLSVAPELEPTADVGYDRKNVIAFRRQAWCASSSPSADASSATCYSHSALAVTTLFKNKNTGELLDADIVFNAVDFGWGDLVAFPDPGPGTIVDFQNALTHELGHVIGLDHSCYAPSDNQPRLMDNTGQPAIDCSSPSLPASIADSTMYPSVSLKDTLRRDLSPDDQQGVCDIYPYLHAACPPDNAEGGCSTLANRPLDSRARCLTVATVGLLSALLVLFHRRRARRI